MGTTTFDFLSIYNNYLDNVFKLLVFNTKSDHDLINQNSTSYSFLVILINNLY